MKISVFRAILAPPAPTEEGRGDSCPSCPSEHRPPCLHWHIFDNTKSLLHSRFVYVFTPIYVVKLRNSKDTFRTKASPKVERLLVLGHLKDQKVVYFQFQQH